MKVYWIRGYGMFCGGAAIIAANSKQEAVKLIKEVKHNFNIGYIEENCVEIALSTDSKEPYEKLYNDYLDGL